MGFAVSEAEEPRPVCESGGDPVCWLSRVCQECGLFVEEEPPATCSRCGATVPAD